MKILSSALLGLIVTLSYGQSTPNPKKQVVRIIFEDVWNKKDFSKLGVSWSDSTVFHIQNRVLILNKAGVIETVNEWHEAFPDFKFTVNQIICEGDIVAINLNYSGTHQKKFLGIDPLNNPINVTEMMFFRINNNRVVEAWEVYDLSGMKNQMLKKN